MAGPSESRSDIARAIIDQRFCDHESLSLTRKKDVFTATDANGKGIYQFTLDGLLLNAKRNPLLTLEYNIELRRWEVFRVTNNGNVLRFSVKESKGRFYVLLDESKNEKKCDFNIRGKWDNESCEIYLRDSTKIIAQKNKDIMTVYSREDCAFIVALVCVVEKFNP